VFCNLVVLPVFLCTRNLFYWRWWWIKNKRAFPPSLTGHFHFRLIPLVPGTIFVSTLPRHLLSLESTSQDLPLRLTVLLITVKPCSHRMNLTELNRTVLEVSPSIYGIFDFHSQWKFKNGIWRSKNRMNIYFPFWPNTENKKRTCVNGIKLPRSDWLHTQRHYRSTIFFH